MTITIGNHQLLSGLTYEEILWLQEDIESEMKERARISDDDIRSRFNFSGRIHAVKLLRKRESLSLGDASQKVSLICEGK
jgi:hypothetical protein